MKTCPGCGFHNTDERDRCLKCGAALEHDWQAAPHKVRLRRIPFHRLSAAAADVYYALRRLFVFPLPQECPRRDPWLAGFLSLLPGLGQAYNRQYRKAALFFAVFVATFWLAIATVLHALSYLFIILFVGWVLFSFNDAAVAAVRINGQEWPRLYSIALYSALFFYLGVFWSLSQFFLVGLFVGVILYSLYSLFWPEGQVSRAKILTTLTVAFGIFLVCCVLSRSGNPVLHRWIYWAQDILAPALRKGDFIYVDSVSYWFREPRLGEIVLYNPRTYRISQGDMLYVVNSYNAIERIVALPGDRFSRDGEHFYRNGERVPPQYQPLNPDGLPDHFDFDVPKDRFLVLISYGVSEKMLFGMLGTFTSPTPREGSSPDWGDACMVARDEIRGRCLLIWHPVGHRRWLTPPKPR